jgi:putative transposase
MIERDHPQLSIRRQSELLGVNRNRLEVPAGVSEEDLLLMRILDEIHMDEPTYGTRRLRVGLSWRGYHVGRGRIRRLMRRMGIEAIYPRPRTSLANRQHPKYPYLLKDLKVERPDQVWCADITYIPMRRGYAYLVAIMDWHSRAVLGWKVSNTLDTRFCLEAFVEAVRTSGRTPEIFNTDQGCQFTSREWIEALESCEGLRISMDGKGRWLDNIFIERFWWSLKHEDIYLRAYADLPELEQGVGRWMKRYNHRRPHQSLDYQTPWSCYRPCPAAEEAA